MLIVQYPHKIKLTTTSVESTQDVDGNWTPGVSAEVEKECRAEPNSGGGYITATDGQRIDFSWTVYLPTSRIKQSETC